MTLSDYESNIVISLGVEHVMLALDYGESNIGTSFGFDNLMLLSQYGAFKSRYIIWLRKSYTFVGLCSFNILDMENQI